MKPRLILLTNVAIMLLVFAAPAFSIKAANFCVETGLLTTVNGSHIVTLGYAYNLGFSWLNLLALIGILILADTTISAASKVRSAHKHPE